MKKLLILLFLAGPLYAVNPALIQEKTQAGSFGPAFLAVVLPSTSLAGDHIIASTIWAASGSILGFADTASHPGGFCWVSDNVNNYYRVNTQAIYNNPGTSEFYVAAVLTSTTSIAGAKTITFNCGSQAGSLITYGYASEWSNTQFTVDATSATSSISFGTSLVSVSIQPTTTTGLLYCQSKAFASNPTGVSSPWHGFSDDTTKWQVVYSIAPGAGGPFRAVMTAAAQNNMAACISLPMAVAVTTTSGMMMTFP